MEDFPIIMATDTTVIKKNRPRTNLGLDIENLTSHNIGNILYCGSSWFRGADFLIKFN